MLKRQNLLINCNQDEKSVINDCIDFGFVYCNAQNVKSSNLTATEVNCKIVDFSRMEDQTTPLNTFVSIKQMYINDEQYKLHPYISIVNRLRYPKADQTYEPHRNTEAPKDADIVSIYEYGDLVYIERSCYLASQNANVSIMACMFREEGNGAYLLTATCWIRTRLKPSINGLNDI